MTGMTGTSCQRWVTHLVMQDDGPHESQGQFLIPIHDVVRSYVYEFDLQKYRK
jgi:hypothetical protein